MEVGLIAVFAMAMIIMNSLLQYCTLMSDKSVSSLESLSDHQLFVTVDREHTTIDSGLKNFVCVDNDGIVYPYIYTYAIIDEMRYPVIPVFNENNRDLILQSDDKADQVYFSDSLYNSLNGTADVRNKEITLLLQSADGKYFEHPTDLRFGGVIRKTYENHYLSQSNEYLMIGYDILKQYYEQDDLLTLKEYPGYTIFSKTFEEYDRLYHELEKTSMGVTPFFDKFEELRKLKTIGMIVKTASVSLSLVLSMVLFVVFEMQYHKKRQKEVQMLKMNGVDYAHMTRMVMLETAIQLMIAFVLTGVMMIVLSLFIPVRFDYTVLCTLIFVIAVFVSASLTNRKVWNINSVMIEEN